MTCLPIYGLSSLLIISLGWLILTARAESSCANDTDAVEMHQPCNNITEPRIQLDPGENHSEFVMFTLSTSRVNESEIVIPTNSSEVAKNETKKSTGPSRTFDSLEKKIRFYSFGVYTPVVLTIGICGNLVTLTVLARGVIKSTATVYLTGIAASDLMYMLVIIPNIFSAYEDISGTLTFKSFYSHFVVYVLPLIQFFYSASTWITVSFSIERYIAICHPMKAQTFCTTSRARISVVCVYALSFLLCGSHWFSRRLVRVTDSANNMTYYSFELSELGSNATYLSARYWVLFLWLTGIPLSLLAFLNISIVAKLRSASEDRKQFANKEGQTAKRKSRDSQITRLLLCIVLVHFLCSVTAATCSLAVGIAGVMVFTSEVYSIALIFGNVLIQTNPVLNFILYATCSNAMQTAIKDLFIPNCPRRSNESISSVTTDVRTFSAIAAAGGSSLEQEIRPD